MDLGVSGLASGFDWRALVDQLTELERVPQQRLLVEQNQLGQRNIAYGSIKTQLTVLRNRLATLKSEDLFDSRKVSVADSDILTATAEPGTPLGTYSIAISQLATAAVLRGSAGIGAALSATDDVSGLTLSDANFASSISSGTITVNGKQVAVDTSASLQDLFDSINTATGGDVTGSYDSATDTITLSSSGEIVLGSASDTSNFLTVARLYNNGTGAITSESALGAVQRTVPLDESNFAVALTDGGSGAGEFKINGVSIAFSTASDSLDNILNRINDSQAGVTAAYDPVNDRIVLSNKSTGDVGIALEDVTGNFLAASGLSSGSLERGQNLLYSVNGGGTLTNFSNTVTESSTGIPGLSFTALQEATTTVQVGSDTEKIKAAINGFIDDFNRTQSLIDSNTASSTDSKGKVTAGTLAGEHDVQELASRLRSIAYAEVSSLSAALNHLSDIGIDTSGFDNKLTLADSTKLDEALANSLGTVKSLFAGESDGLAVALDDYLESVVGEEGSLVARQETLTRQSGDIDTQIANMERLVQSNRQRLIDSFVAMEKAQAQINQQLQFLAQRFGGAPK